ncbi:hypothetical protein [Streptomyces sp. NPDC057910]|uniref:hypothetical protein n=1 Tax=Streptomyces sp. NPDC057910 TaxID=3346278 RepID=UPI0036E7FB44
MASQLRVVQGGAVLLEPVTADPWEFQADCVEAFVASWRARGFSPVTVENDIGLLERTLTALGRPAWDVTPEDIDRVVGDLALAGRAASTRREYVQIFKGFHRFLQVRKAVEIEAGFGVRLVCPVDEFNASRHVGDDSPAQLPPPTPERVAEFFDFLKAGSPPPASTHPPPGTTKLLSYPGPSAMRHGTGIKKQREIDGQITVRRTRGPSGSGRAPR